MKKRFGKIGVLAGGPSSEREISLRSGRAVHKALVEEGLDAIFLDCGADICDIIKKIKIDTAFIALHGRFGEDGTVQKMLEDASIPYTGSGPLASAIALDKIASKEAFIRKGIATPRHVVLDKASSGADVVDILGLPVVIKPQLEGSSIGLSVVREKDGLDKALAAAFKYGDKVVAEEYIDGRELTVGMLDDKPLPVIEVVTKNRLYDYDAKYKDSETRYLIPAPIDESIYRKAQECGSLAHAALGCRSFSRVDMMADTSGKIFVLEVNTIPGMTERSLLPKAAEASGINFNRLCVRLIENALKGYKR